MLRNTPTFFPSMQPLVDRYRAFILDLWGVIHDGQALYPGVRETLLAMRHAGAKVIFLSNAPRRAVMAQAVLDRLGIESSLYDQILTSGEEAFRYLCGPAARQELGVRPYFMGLESDGPLLDGVPMQRAETAAEADFFLCSGFDYFFQPLSEVVPRLSAALAKDLPMLCINPDIEVIRITGERVLCAGVIAAEYASMGGRVHYIGKPWPEVYTTCLSALDGVPREQILAVGDGLRTDIKGANGANIDCALVTGGIIALREDPLDLTSEEGKSQAVALCEAAGVMPTHIVPQFGLI